MITTRLHDGRQFRSISAAARALGIDHTTISYHLDTHGNTSKAGTQRRSVDFEGVTYPSIAVASRETGLSRCAINWRRGYRKPKVVA